MNKVINQYNHQLSKKLVAKSQKGESQKHVEWWYAQGVEQSKRTLNEWAYENNYK